MFLVSIIIPCFNHGKYLEECINSIIKQSYNNWECIIVNDGSTDQTSEIAEALIKKDSRIKYVYKENGGLSSARNAGIEIAIGKYILPLDADDKISSHYLEKALEKFETNPILKLVYGNGYRFGEEDLFWDMGQYSYKELLLENKIFCSAIFKREDWLKCGGYDEALKLGWEDWEFWINILNKNDLVFKLEDVVFYYRIRKNSMLRETTHQNYLDTIRYIFYKHWDKYVDMFDDPLVSYSKKTENNIAYSKKQNFISRVYKKYILDAD